MRCSSHQSCASTPVVADWLKDLAAALSAEPTVDAAIQRVWELNRLCGIGTLRDYGVIEDMIVPMAAKAMEDGCRLATPGDVSEQDMIQLYKEAMQDRSYEINKTGSRSFERA